MKYIAIKDTRGNTNFWTIKGCDSQTNTYYINSRTTISTIEKSSCFIKDNLLFTNEIRDIENSEIELESISEYKLYWESVKNDPEWLFTHEILFILDRCSYLD